MHIREFAQEGKATVREIAKSVGVTTATVGRTKQYLTKDDQMTL